MTEVDYYHMIFKNDLSDVLLSTSFYKTMEGQWQDLKSCIMKEIRHLNNRLSKDTGLNMVSVVELRLNLNLARVLLISYNKIKKKLSVDTFNEFRN